MIEGYQIKAGDRCLVVDDVVTTAKSTIQAIKVVEENKSIVQQITCLVDREQGGTKALSQYCFTPVFTRSELEN